MMRIWLIAAMIVLTLIAVDITIRIGWDRFISGIGSLVDGQRHTQQEQPPSEARRISPAQMAPHDSFGDGIKVVGKDIKPGTYRTRVRAPGCYWARLAEFSGRDILANGNESGPVIVTIGPSDKGFESRKCGLWTTDLSAITKSLDAPFSDGMFIIGTDITPGTWRTDTPESCYWARLRGFSGGGGDTISNANYKGIVTIEATDKGFKSHHCGTWTLAAPLGPSETRDAERVIPGTAQPRTTPPQQKPLVPVATPYAVAGEPDDWYAFSHESQQCIVPDMRLSEFLALYDKLGEHYTMQDVTERGQVVQTTMDVQPGGIYPEGLRIIWYRGKARCEQAQRTKQQSQEQRREKYR